jgi:hypothetical protein
MSNHRKSTLSHLARASLFWLKPVAFVLGLLLMLYGILALLSGCASIHPTANVSALNISPSVTLDGRTLDKVGKYSGDVKAVIDTKIVHGTAQKLVTLKSDTFWPWLSSFGVWYFIGGLSIALGLLGALLRAFKWPSIGYRASVVLMVFGGALLAGVTVLKLFWGYLLGIFALGAFIFGVEWALHHQSTLGGVQLSWAALVRWLCSKFSAKKQPVVSTTTPVSPAPLESPADIAERSKAS